jgi:hypothetical protein
MDLAGFGSNRRIIERAGPVSFPVQPEEQTAAGSAAAPTVGRAEHEITD